MGLVIEYSLEARTVRLLRQKLDYVRSCGVGTLDLNDELSRTACPGYLDREPAPKFVITPAVSVWKRADWAFHELVLV